VVVASSNLAVIIAAWTASSAGLHHLLTFYRERPAAVIVAHKKFLASRLAESLLVIAAVLYYREWGTLDVPLLNAHVQSGAPVPSAVLAATVLVAGAALLKSAQLPLHGWLIQVMEAPTPVSALLHAGIVNLGGFVLIRLSPLIDASFAAQGLLVVVGSLTAALAGLVMLTRVTIKVRLAWSTCSQMGLMMVECGLGLYDLALLHLVAHALYKAYAFLTSGQAVRDGLERRLITLAGTGVPPPHRLWPLLTLSLAWVVAVTSAALWHVALGLAPVSWIVPVLLACGLATLLWTTAGGLRVTWTRLVELTAATQLYFGWHWLFAACIGIRSAQASSILSAWACMVFLMLYMAQVWVLTRRRAAPATRLYDWIYAGLYLDESMTRLTFQLWPVRVHSARPGDQHLAQPRSRP
jgi:NAD(P)H-quinone oxidoreductase subunit 5